MFRADVENFFVEAAEAEDESSRAAVLQRLHEKVLSNVYGVPFWMETPAFFASDRVDLSNINRFDLRMRFYDITWND